MDKFKFDKKYLKISLYVVLTVFLIRIVDSVLGVIPNLSIGAVSLAGTLFSLLFPIILGFIIAYLLIGPVRALERFFREKCHIKRQGVCRALGIIITYLVLLGVILGMVFGILSMVSGQISKNSSIFGLISDYIKTIGSGADLTAQVESMNIPFADVLGPRITELAEWLQGFIQDLVGDFANWILSLGSNMLSILISLILSIYVISSQEFFLSIWRRAYYFVFRDRPIGLSIKRGLRIINYTFSNYIRGQLIEACCVAALCSLVLVLFDVDYALVIGVITGILNLIPYVGSTIGVILGGLMGLLTHDGWTALWVVLCLFAVQQLDANVLCPRIVGNTVGVHPAIILIAITIGGSQWGLLGMILAVPVTASLITLLKLWYQRNYETSYQKFEEVEEDLLFPDEEETRPKEENFWKRFKNTAKSVAANMATESESEPVADPESDSAKENTEPGSTEEDVGLDSEKEAL